MTIRSTHVKFGPQWLRRGVLAGMAASSLWQAPAQAGDALAQRLDAVLDRWVAQGRIVGAVVLVARDGALVYRRAAGFADREARRPVRRDTIFRLASMTKLLVSATALALVERGTLRLDDPVARWLPYFKPRQPDGRRPVITIRHLMTDTSGLTYAFLEPEDSAYRRLGISEWPDCSHATREQNLRKLATAPLVFAPGSEWRYSLATDVLGVVIERASGLSLSQAVARFVTEPLGMTDTSFRVVDRGRLAHAYRDGDTRAVRMDPTLDRIPMGTGIRSRSSASMPPAPVLRAAPA